MGPLMDGFDYTLRYEVVAQGRLAAIEAAVGMLRSNVKLNAVLDAERTRGDDWSVLLHVHETPVDHPADATFAR